MALLTRTITGNIGHVSALDANVANSKITFTLVDQTGRPASTFDATTYERVAGRFSTLADATGAFSIALWPTDRASDPVMYACEIEVFGSNVIRAPLAYDTTPMLFTDWAAQSSSVTIDNSIIVSHATNQINTTVATTNNDSIDGVDTGLFNGAEWIVQLTEAVTGNTVIFKVLAMNNAGTAVWNEYATVGTFSLYAATAFVDVSANTLSLFIQNNSVNQISVLALRLPV